MSDNAQDDLFIDNGLVGAKLAGLTCRIDWRRTTNYAAAIGDANPAYLDDSRPGGLLAPPMFAAALTWPVASNLGEQLGGALPPEALVRMVHAAEHLVCHRSIIPGERLSISGEIAALIAKKNSTLMVLRLDALDAQNRPVFTEYISPLFRGVACRGGTKGASDVPVAAPPAPAAEPLWEASQFIDRAMPFVYDGCSDIVFPIHTSVSFAKAVGLPDILLQGTATLAMAARELVNREADGDPSRLRELACRFTGMVIPGQSIRIRLTARRCEGNAILLRFSVLNDRDETALDDGFARLDQ